MAYESEDAVHFGSSHNKVQADAEATAAAALAAHLADTADAHDASAVSADSTTLVGTGTDVQAVLEELDNGIADHLADATAAHAASAVSIADAGSDFTATTVEGALDELQAFDELLAVASVNFVIDGGGATITTGIKGDVVLDFACTILSATLLADQSGSIVVNIWKDTYANFPPVVGDKITASAPPTITTATKSQDATLTGWTLSIAAGDVLRFNVDSATTIQRVTLVLKVVRT